MYIGKMFSADFGESTIEFKIEGDFTVKAGKYFILSEEEYTALNKVESSHDVKESIIKERDVKLLKAYNKWRRGDDGLIMPHPQDIGECIDRVVNYLEKHFEQRNKDL